MKAKNHVKTKISIKNDSEEIKNGFDKGIDFEETRKIFKGKIKELITDLRNDYNVHKVKALSNIVIALVSLVNGSRISESIEAVFKFINNKNLNKVIVPIAKRKDGETRPMLLPKEINKEILEYIEKIIAGADPQKLQSKVRTYLTDNYGFNTHSLRYAAINYLITEKQRPLNVVSKLVGHKSMNMLINYTQNKNVSSTLESMNSGKF
jgi:integrase